MPIEACIATGPRGADSEANTIDLPWSAADFSRRSLRVLLEPEDDHAHNWDKKMRMGNKCEELAEQNLNAMLQQI